MDQNGRAAEQAVWPGWAFAPTARAVSLHGFSLTVGMPFRNVLKSLLDRRHGICATDESGNSLVHTVRTRAIDLPRRFSGLTQACGSAQAAKLELPEVLQLLLSYGCPAHDLNEARKRSRIPCRLLVPYHQHPVTLVRS